jgi:hypothetical protein
LRLRCIYKRDKKMKITKLTTFIVPPRWCFLKIETDEGVTGWGEPVVEGRAHTVAAAVEELSDYLIGKDPRNIEDIWTVLYRGGFYRGGAIHMSAWPASIRRCGTSRARPWACRSAICWAVRCATRSACIRGSAATVRPTPRAPPKRPWPVASLR